MKNAVIVCFWGFVLILTGCATKGVAVKVDDENVFHSYDNPKIEIRVARDIKYIKEDDDQHEMRPGNRDAGREMMPVASRRYSFLNPYDPESGSVKIVSIEIENFKTDHSRWIPPDFKVFPGVIKYGTARFGNVDYQYGIALNQHSVSSIKNDRFKEAYMKQGYSGPMKMMTKIYSRVFGDDGNGIITIVYSESIPKYMDWQPSSSLTEEKKQFLEAFQKRCGQNLKIID